MQGAALTLAAEVRAEVGDRGRPDVLLVSDMVHVPALVGLARDVLATVPVVLYMHENQLTYPLPDDAAPDYSYAVVNWLSMASADCVVFNSEYHRRSWFDALPRLLRRFPDYRHTGSVEAVESRSAVLPVGIDAHRLAGSRHTAAPPLVLWNHRWEYDKNPRAFFAALSAVAGRGVDFRVAIAGQQFQTVPDDFAAARQDFGDRVVQFGTLDRGAYEDLLRRSGVVVSTALHEFFGLSVLEAVAAGACPVLPNRLSYPELFPPDCLYDDDDAGVVGLVDRLCRLLTDDDARRAQAASAHARAVEYDWSLVAPKYDALLARAAGVGSAP